MTRYWPDSQLDRITPPQVLDERGKAILRSLDHIIGERPIEEFYVRDAVTCPSEALPALIAETSMEEFIEPGLPEAIVRRILKHAWLLQSLAGKDDGVLLGLSLLGINASRVGTMDCSIAPLTEPDMRTTHPALWIGPSKCQLKLGRYLRGVKFHPSGFQRYQSSCEPGNRIGPRHARTVGLVPNTPAAIRGTGGSPAARPHCQKMPEKEAGSLLLTHDDSSQPTADMSVEYTQSLDTLFRAEPEVRHPPVEVAAETRHTR